MEPRSNDSTDAPAFRGDAGPPTPAEVGVSGADVSVTGDGLDSDALDLAAAPVLHDVNAPSAPGSPSAEARTTDFDREWEQSREGQSFAEAVASGPLVPPREPIGARIAALMTRRHWLMLPLCIALLWGAVSYRPPGESLSLQVGDVATRDIVAPHGATVLDRELTERNRDAAAELVPPQYDVRTPAAAQAQSELRVLLDAAHREIMAADLARSARPKTAKADSTKGKASRDTNAGGASGGDKKDVATAPLESVDTRVRRLNSALENKLPPATARQILQTVPERWRAVAHEAGAALRAAYEYKGFSQKIRSDVADDRLAARRRMLTTVKDRAPRSNLLPSEVETAFLLASSVGLVPNLVVNGDKTEHARDVARDNVAQVFRSISPGSVVVAAGTRIDAERRAELQDLDVITPRFAWPAALARLALSIVVICFAAAYIARLHPQLENEPASLWLAAMVPIAFVAIFRWALRAPHGDLTMVPLSAISALLLTMLINERLGLLAAFSVPALCALVARAEPGLFLAGALSSAVGVLSVAEISSRSHIARGALILAGTNAVLALALGLLRESGAEDTLYLAGWGALGGGASVLAAVGLAQMLERPFNITTHLRLLELTGADEAVMRRMQSEAPGTYTHSLMVGLLSEAAGKAVGADALLCRVGGMYHDIGKLRRPHCFVENQSGENVHDRLSPHLSALLIVSHVRDGIELGRALKLPAPVIDIIAQHHGTSLIAYFFHRAKNAVSADRLPDETLFRYPGPKPQSKEAAIVLLADTVEASSRALHDLTMESLEAHIRTMLHARQADGELSECDLTMRDLATIHASFAHVLRGVLHHRIEYPDPASADKNWVQDALTAPQGGEPHAEHRRSDHRWSERRNRHEETTHEPTTENGRARDGRAKEGGEGRQPREGKERSRNRKRITKPRRGPGPEEKPALTDAAAAGTPTGASPGTVEADASGVLEPQRGALLRLANGRVVRKRPLSSEQDESFETGGQGNGSGAPAAPEVNGHGAGGGSALSEHGAQRPRSEAA